MKKKKKHVLIIFFHILLLVSWDVSIICCNVYFLFWYAPRKLNGNLFISARTVWNDWRWIADIFFFFLLSLFKEKWMFFFVCLFFLMENICQKWKTHVKSYIIWNSNEKNARDFEWIYPFFLVPFILTRWPLSNIVAVNLCQLILCNLKRIVAFIKSLFFKSWF